MTINEAYRQLGFSVVEQAVLDIKDASIHLRPRSDNYAPEKNAASAVAFLKESEWCWTLSGLDGLTILTKLKAKGIWPISK